MSNLAKALSNMEKDAADLVVKSENFQGAQSSVTASINKADADASTANGDLSDGAEKSNKKVQETEGSFQKSEDPKAADVVQDPPKGDDPEKKDDDVKKSVPEVNSLEKSIQDSEAGKNAFEVSGFLKEMTAQLSKSLEGVQGTLHDANGTTEETVEAFAKSFGAIAKSQQAVMEQNIQLTSLVKSMAGTMEAMSARLESIEEQPNMRKSVRDISVHNKDFNKSIVEKGQQDLSKSEKLNIAMDLIAKGDTVQPLDILNLESGAKLRPEVEQRIAQVAAQR